VLDLVTALRDVADQPLPDPEFEPARPGEVRRSCLDVSRARQELHWEPQVQLRGGLRTILAGL
jgi:UDP-glucose 4-epimerase